MRVLFGKSDDGRLCSWGAGRPGPRRVPGATMAVRSGHTDLPHDLAQFVVEASLGLEHGFWNLVANGATFKSLGRRPTRPGRQEEPRRNADERELLVSWLEWHRATMVHKCEGLAADQLGQRSYPPSDLTLLGLVRHLTEMERNYFAGHADLLREAIDGGTGE